jgi:hypothetical protein
MQLKIFNTIRLKYCIPYSKHRRKQVIGEISINTAVLLIHAINHRSAEETETKKFVMKEVLVSIGLFHKTRRELFHLIV